MNDTESNLRRELQESQSEVRRLKRRLNGIYACIFITLAVISPDFRIAAITIGIMILFALLVSPVRHLIFPSIFRKREKQPPLPEAP